jgi:hypothetical protein
MTYHHRPIVLTPSVKAFFRGYTIGIILSPLLIGLYLIWKTESKRRSISYRITQNMLTIVHGKYSRNINLENIKDVETNYDPFGLGTIIVRASGQEYSLFGLKEPEKVANTLTGS